VRQPGSRPCDRPAGSIFVATPTFASPRGETKCQQPRKQAKATFGRFQDAVSTGDAEVISKRIDELVEPDVLFHMPLPIEAMGA
jgi:hypothetical protein